MPEREYKKPEDEGFGTPSGKVEIHCRILEERGYDPVPKWEVLSRLPSQLSEEYPLLLSNAKSNTYMLSGFKMIDSLRKRDPDPIVKLNTETAREAGLKDGDWIYIETKKGKITQRLSVDHNLDS